MSRDIPNKENGYLMNLYRNPEAGWLFGVCAGLGDHFGKPYWMMRLAAVTLFLFTGELAILLYIAGIFLLAKNPEKTRGRRWRSQCGYSGRRTCNGRGERRGEENGHRESPQTDTREGRRAADRERYADAHAGAAHAGRETLFTYSPTPGKRLKEARRRLKALDMRLRSMETYVTSSKYRFNREINNL